MTAYATRDDVIQCYRHILKREPENEKVVEGHLAAKLTLWELIRRILNSEEHKEISQNNGLPSLHKCRNPRYLVKSLGPAQKYQCFLSNYSFLNQTLTPASMERLIYRDIELVEHRVGEIRYSVAIQVSRNVINEGELSLHFRAGIEPLYILSFSIVPGEVVDLDCPFTLLISRMQGWSAGKFEAIRQATRDLRDIAPQALLYVVLDGIAQAMGLDHIVGIASRSHICFVEGSDKIFDQVYDRFFESIGAQGPRNGFYFSNVPMAQKPILHIKAGHRLRTKFKRELKQTLSQSARSAWEQLCQAPVAASA